MGNARDERLAAWVNSCAAGRFLFSPPLAHVTPAPICVVCVLAPPWGNPWTQSPFPPQPASFNSANAPLASPGSGVARRVSPTTFCVGSGAQGGSGVCRLAEPSAPLRGLPASFDRAAGSEPRDRYGVKPREPPRTPASLAGLLAGIAAGAMPQGGSQSLAGQSTQPVP